MGSHYNHLSYEERKMLESQLNIPDISLKTISSSLNRSDKCIRYEIKTHRYIVIRSNKRNKCGRQDNCSVRHLCNHCENGKCSYCSFTPCNELCPDFIDSPVCKRIDRFPFVCSTCPDIKTCTLPKFFYSASKADEQAAFNNSSWKLGFKKSIQEMNCIISAVQQGIANNLSPAVIIHEYKLPISVSTLYAYIDQGLIPNVHNIDLKAKVRYKLNQQPRERKIKDYKHLERQKIRRIYFTSFRA